MAVQIQTLYIAIEFQKVRFVPCTLFRRCLIITSQFRNNKSRMEIDPNAQFTNTSQRLDPSRCVDLIVLGINYRSNEDDVRNYFQQFGELVFCEVRKQF